jgi:hypothetical protein
MIWIKDSSSLWLQENEVEKGSSWWFENIHPEDSIKMSIKFFHRTKNREWQDEYRFKCADNTYKYVLDRAFLLDENGKLE